MPSHMAPPGIPSICRDPRAHLGGGLVREGDREHGRAARRPRSGSARRCVREHAGLAAARAREHQHRPGGAVTAARCASFSGLRMAERSMRAAILPQASRGVLTQRLPAAAHQQRLTSSGSPVVAQLRAAREISCALDLPVREPHDDLRPFEPEKHVDLCSWPSVRPASSPLRLPQRARVRAR